MPLASLLSFLSVALSGVASAQTSMPAAISTDALLRTRAAENEACRGGAEDDPVTDRACERREAASKRLRAVGFCYGREGEAGYQTDWHRCGPGFERR